MIYGSILADLLGQLRPAVRIGDLSAIADVVRDAIREEPFVSQASSAQLLHSELGSNRASYSGQSRLRFTSS
jgi:hypothetical protein